ncbi:MAG: hypothetical protein JSV82_09145 [Planctomycetota bacterium]|nr:MAG: hypothetical protein JSV82_09145 [Planctomycetota bacterium]
MDVDLTKRILIRCFLYGWALLLLWFLMYVIMADWIYTVHSKFFDISMHDFALMNYYGMALVKSFIVLVFLIPYVAIHFADKKRSSN